MESKALYNAHSHLLYKVVWNEWAYIGVGDDFNEDAVQRTISTVFGEEVIYFVIDRRTGGEIKIADIVPFIKLHLPTQGVTLWNKSLTNVMTFAPIGVVRDGHVRIT